jgi:hypothetical protein
MATKSDTILSASNKYRELIGTQQEEKAKRERQEIIKDWHNYLNSGILKQTIFLQYDEELVKKLHEITDHYSELYDAVMRDEGLADGKVWPMIIKAQELINKKLEEL